MNLAAVQDTKRANWLQIVVLALCVVVGFVDGYDVQAIAYVAPVLRQELHLDPNALARLLAAASLGTFVGAIIWGPIVDRVGRRWIMAGNGFGFGILTYLTALFARDDFFREGLSGHRHFALPRLAMVRPAAGR